ncbi:MAG: hypothetical protein ACI9FR_000723 [Cryomorphaceae bacterium]|jgi:hypothetical protein
MAQARRIKRKPAKKANKARPVANLPWGLIIVILVCGIVLGMMLMGVQKGDSDFGAGLKQLFKSSEPAEDSDQAIAALIEDRGADKTFTFYDMLKDDEQFMPDDLPEAAPTRANDNLHYYLQAASFREEVDADKLRARLALKGFKSTTQARRVPDSGLYFRVRLGPYADKRKAKTVKNKLQRLGVRPFIFTVKKNS